MVVWPGTRWQWWGEQADGRQPLLLHNCLRARRTDFATMTVSTIQSKSNTLVSLRGTCPYSYVLDCLWLVDMLNGRSETEDYEAILWAFCISCDYSTLVQLMKIRNILELFCYALGQGCGVQTLLCTWLSIVFHVICVLLK